MYNTYSLLDDRILKMVAKFKWDNYHANYLVITYIHNRIELWRAIFECFPVFSRGFFEIFANGEHFANCESI